MNHTHDDRDSGAAACTLAPDALNARIDDWRRLAAQALRRDHEPGRLHTTYPNRLEVAQLLAELVEAEKHCCTFLQFDVQPRGEEIDVELRYPSHFAGMLARVLDATGASNDV